MIFTVFKALPVIQPVLFCNLDNDTKGIGQEHMEGRSLQENIGLRTLGQI